MSYRLLLKYVKISFNTLWFFLSAYGCSQSDQLCDLKSSDNKTICAEASDVLGREVSKIPVPLFSENSAEQLPSTERYENGFAITRFGGRVRQRHAREGGEYFRLYRIYPPFYFENRTFEVQVTDKTATGIQEVVFDITMDHPIGGDQPQRITGRFFYSGYPSKAGYFHGGYFEDVSFEFDDDRYHYRFELKNSHVLGFPIEVKAGELMEMEFTFNLAKIDGVGGARGASNYYSRAWLIRLGEPGLLSWDATGPLPLGERSSGKDSRPLEDELLLGGKTTISRNLSEEGQRSFQQVAGNMAPEHIQDFVEGRRLHHTNFTNGEHSEGGNPIFNTHKGKLGPLYNGFSCISCHINNGRGLPVAEQGQQNSMIFKVSADLELGATLQTAGIDDHKPEAVVELEAYEYLDGVFSDGTSYKIRKPIYRVTSGKSMINEYTAVVAPALVGLGLLEAVDESSILDLEDADDKNGDGISGRASLVIDGSGTLRLGRFGWKAEKATIKEQIAVALFEDMGVSSSIFSDLENSIELEDSDLLKLRTYISLLGVPPRRDFKDARLARGEELFEQAECHLCHQPSWETSAQAPFPELRKQKIWPYTDLLVHDMGPELSSSLSANKVTEREWRTPPLWGIGWTKLVGEGQESYLHDGRARSLQEAILWHGGEGRRSQALFKTMSADDRSDLLYFLESL